MLSVFLRQHSVRDGMRRGGSGRREKCFHLIPETNKSLLLKKNKKANCFSYLKTKDYFSGLGFWTSNEDAGCWDASSLYWNTWVHVPALMPDPSLQPVQIRGGAMGDGSSGSSLSPSWGPGLSAEFLAVAWPSSGHFVG